MGTTKSELFSDEHNELSGLFKALGHPARLAIIQYLASVNTCVCGDIVEEVQLAQPTISQHLKELKLAGLIKGTVEGTSVCYCIDQAGMRRLLDFLTAINLKNETTNSCC